MDPRLGLVVGTVNQATTPSASPPVSAPPKVYQGKVQVNINYFFLKPN